MHRVDTDYSVDGSFSDGNQTTGAPGTRVDAAWLNAVQEEIANVIEAAGLTLAKGTNNQLVAATRGYTDAKDATRKSYTDALQPRLIARVNADATVRRWVPAPDVTFPAPVNLLHPSTGVYEIDLTTEIGMTTDGIVTGSVETAGYTATFIPILGGLRITTRNAAGAVADAPFSFVVHAP
jgi:hypothetical protein